MQRVYEGMKIAGGSVMWVDRESDTFAVEIGPMEPLYYKLSAYEKYGKLVNPSSTYYGGKSRHRRATRKVSRKSRKSRKPRRN